MFTRLMNAVSRSGDGDTDPVGPVTRRATGIVDLPPGSEDELLADALKEKYDGNR